MRYSQGRLGRIFLVKFENKDDILQSLEGFVREKRLQSASLFFSGHSTGANW
jgi:predicted DNA-binding protein with PD1-like motif